jgi:hypothetical protein
MLCSIASACTSSAPRPSTTATTASSKAAPLPPLTPPTFEQVESWCAHAVERPIAECVAEVGALVLSSPLVQSDPAWMKEGALGAACKEAKTGVVCHAGGRVTCTEGLVTDVLPCAAMGMVCSAGSSGAECVRAGCATGARVQCHDGFLDSCNETHSETTRNRCPSGGPCRDDGAGSFTCTLTTACDVTACDDDGVAKVCVAGEPRSVQCRQAGWDCPAQGLPGLPPSPCSLPTTGEACKAEQPSCSGGRLRYCLNGHVRIVDCAAMNLECRESPTVGAHCE